VKTPYPVSATGLALLAAFALLTVTSIELRFDRLGTFLFFAGGACLGLSLAEFVLARRARRRLSPLEAPTRIDSS
jgi:hypothetical protein